ncbi:MAG: hypothetical protein LYZ69_04730 [Nitrososphaerales archaeon]|nr:hypothetical protein [Nitrososphaerales archaeon]
MRRVLRLYSGGACLEVGAGNGGSLLELSRSFRVVVGTDVVRPDASDWREAGSSYIMADAAACFRSGSFDLVAFNPPYVPSEGIADRAVDGGREGVEVALHFLREAMGAVKEDGKILMLVSSDNPLRVLEQECDARGCTMRRVADARLFYETLSVYEVSRRGKSQS